MKSVDTGKDKVKKICEVLKRETLDPAKKEADVIIHKAREDAARIIEDAKREAQNAIEEAKRKIEEERNVFQASINVACKKSLDMLRQEIENKLFHTELQAFVGKNMQNAHTIAELISAIVKAIEKEGTEANLRAIVPSSVSAKEINGQLVKGILERLEKNSVELGEIEGGVEVKVVDKNLTIDMTEEALKSLVASYVRDDFRSVIFSA